MASLNVCKAEIVNGVAYVDIDIVGGELRVSGQDLADYEYEYFYSLSRLDTTKLVEKLCEETGAKSRTIADKLIMIRDYFGEELDFCKNMREYCDANEIKYKFFSMRH